MRRYRNEYMHMVIGYMPFYYLYIFGFAYLSDQFSDSLGNFSAQNRLAVFRYPDQMVFEVISGMA